LIADLASNLISVYNISGNAFFIKAGLNILIVFLAVSKVAWPFIYILKQIDSDSRWCWVISLNLLVQNFMSLGQISYNSMKSASYTQL
jgi:hypothetical protein